MSTEITKIYIRNSIELFRVSCLVTRVSCLVSRVSNTFFNSVFRFYMFQGQDSYLIVTLSKSETYKETIKEKSTTLPYRTVVAIHKRIHVRPKQNEYSYEYRTSTVNRARGRIGDTSHSSSYCTVPYCTVGASVPYISPSSISRRGISK